MTTPAYDTVNWFQIGTDDSDTAKNFYGGMFGWKFTLDPADGGSYELITYPGSEAPVGGISPTDDADKNHATFLVLVRDTEVACKLAQELGGEVIFPPTTAPSGLTFAHIKDPSGNRFGIYTPPPA
ncbi:VOC family protein [Spirillospora sp. CA-294931]|uniref:VOC family protein n=1 Tax=Spirillospora sp. CA-294931 TaxID=3240042 RepID=UPI003D940724